MGFIKFRNEDYQKTKYTDNYYLLTKIHKNHWHQLKLTYSTNAICGELIFNFGTGGGNREGIEIIY